MLGHGIKIHLIFQKEQDSIAGISVYYLDDLVLRTLRVSELLLNDRNETLASNLYYNRMEFTNINKNMGHVYIKISLYK